MPKFSKFSKMERGRTAFAGLPPPVLMELRFDVSENPLKFVYYYTI
ncbi:MAG TPA: hypothetical protein PKJ95_04360 [Atribacterota bacterium]|nr:hypothetical protein [Atribacterota bacterium]